MEESFTIDFVLWQKEDEAVSHLKFSMTSGKKFPQRLIFKDVLRKRLTARQKIRVNERERECVQQEERDKRKSVVGESETVAEQVKRENKQKRKKMVKTKSAKATPSNGGRF